MKLFFIFTLSITSVNALAQSDSEKFNANNYHIDSLKKIYGKHKILLKDYELATLIALSYYPELIDERIIFKYSGINSTARTTVTFGSIFKKVNKQYIIYINDDIEKTGMLLNQAPFDAQVGLIGHELAHALDFESKSFLDLAWWGVSYLWVKQRTKIEKLSDKITIKHGLGMALFQWADFVLNHSTANRRYLKMKESKYLSPDEILEYMKKHQYSFKGD